MIYKDILSILKNNKIIVEGFSFIFGLRILQMGLGFASTYFLVRALSVEEYGYYNLVISILATLSVFSLSEMNSLVTQSVARGHHGIYAKALKKSFLCSLLGSIIALAISTYYFFFDEHTQVAYGTLLVAVFLPAYHAFILWKGYRLAQHKFKEMTTLEAASSIGISLSIIAASQIFPSNYLIPLLCFLIIPSSLNALMTWLDLKRISPDSTEEEGGISYGFKTSLYSGINVIAANLDRIIVFWFLSPAAVAFFSAADRISDVFKSLTQDLAAAMAPKMAKQTGYTKRLDDLFLLYSLIMGIGIAFFAFTVLPPLMHLIFSEKYSQSIPYAQALLLSVAIGNTSIMRFRYIRSTLDFSSYKKVTLIQSISRILSLMALVPFLGIWGAVASAFISRIVTALTIQTLIKKHHLLEN